MVFWVGTRLNQQHTEKHLLDNSPTNQLAISQESRRGLVNSPTEIY